MNLRWHIFAEAEGDRDMWVIFSPSGVEVRTGQFVSVTLLIPLCVSLSVSHFF